MIHHELFDLQNETALVTGGGTGLGQGFARTLAAAGATVLVCARREEKLAETVEMIKQAGGDAHALPLDVSSVDSIQACLTQAAGISPITVLVNNAGVGTDRLLKDMPESMWDLALDTNLKGCWLLSREVVKDWIARDSGGSIINIASVLATHAQLGTGAYAAAKAGLVHLTKAMACEWARHGVRVNAISPGYYQTELAGEFLSSDYGKKLIKRIPQRRLGQLGDLDGAILLLASKASAYMTGSIINVDGGLSVPTV